VLPPAPCRLFCEDDEEPECEPGSYWNPCPDDEEPACEPGSTWNPCPDEEEEKKEIEWDNIDEMVYGKWGWSISGD